MSQQSQHSVEAHIESLKRDRELISKNVQSLAARLGASQAEILNRDEELRHAERTLEAVNAAIGTIREQLVQAAANLATTERSMERVIQTVHELTALQEEVDAWRKEALESQRVGPGASGLDQRIGAFTRALRTYLLALGHSAVRPANVEGVRLDEDYAPQMETRRLRSLGSASDKPRVIAAYSLALAAASRAVAGLHPGIVVLDEPLQQNPDDPHRNLFSEFLSKDLAQAGDFQTIIFTSLRGSEVKLLRERGTTVVTPAGEHFLRLDAPPKAAPDAPEPGTGTEPQGNSGTSA